MSRKKKTREEFIDENASLFWYIRQDKLHSISDEVLVEFIINYGSLHAIKELFEIVGIKKLTEIYYKIQGRKIGNYFPELYNFFGLLIKKYNE